MNRYYIADIIGTGEPDIDEFRLAVAEFPGTGWGWDHPAPMYPVAGGWGLAKVMISNPEGYAAMEDDPRIDPLPPLAITDSLDGVDTSRVRAALARRGIDESTLDEASTFGDLLANIRAQVVM
jgi:hypothetical protein